jgi:hypothetical protein
LALLLVPFPGTDYFGFAFLGPTLWRVNYLLEVAYWGYPEVNAHLGMRYAARIVGCLDIKHTSGELACHPQWGIIL